MVGFKIFLKTVLKEEILDVSVYSHSWVHKVLSFHGCSVPYILNERVEIIAYAAPILFLPKSIVYINEFSVRPG